MDIINNIQQSKSYLWGLYKTEKHPVSLASGQGASGIMVQLVKEFTDKTRSDIKKWRESMDATDDIDDPRWYLQQDLYDNLLTDGHLAAVINIRKAATMSRRSMVKDAKSGTEIPEQTAYFQTEWWYNMMEYLLDSVFRYYTVMELVDPTTNTWQLIPRRNCVPQTGMIYFEVAGNKGVNYTDPAFAKNVIELKSVSSKYGILNNIIPQLIWKRNAQQVWADFAERFGIPLISAETTRTDKLTIDKIQKGMKNLGQAAQAILPEGTKITIHDSVQKGDPHKVFLEQINLANDEISKNILGGTMVIDNGSSRSQSEVHERTLDEKIAESDRRMIEFFVNGKLIPLLRNWGFKFTDTSVFAFDRTESIGISDHWKIVNEALQSYEIDPDWVSNRFNFPIIGKKKTPTTPEPGKPKAAFSANFQ